MTVDGHDPLEAYTKTDEEVRSTPFWFRPEWWHPDGARQRVQPEWWSPTLDALSPHPKRAGFQKITQNDVFAIASEAHPLTPVRTMVAATVWGTGDSGFLVGRRAKYLTANSKQGVEASLTAAAATLVEQGPEAAFTAMQRGGSLNLPHLGPSFFTKLLYFLDTPERSPRALVLDRFVAIGLNSVRGTDWPLWGFTARHYSDYLNWATEYALRTDTKCCDASEVEHALFTYGKALASGSDPSA